MPLVALIAQGRAAAEALMTDACTIVEVTGTTTDPETGETVDETEPVYSGKCRLQQAAPTASETTIGEARALVVARVLQLPVAASAGVRADHVVTMTACELDPDVVGRKLAVRGEHAKSHATMRRLLVEELTS